MSLKGYIYNTPAKISTHTILILFLFCQFFIPAYSSYNTNVLSQQVVPGSTLVFHKDLFSSDKQMPIPQNIGLTNVNFEISAVSYGAGTELIELVYINDSSQNVQIRLKKMPQLVAPDKPNLSIQKLILKCKRNIMDKNGNVIIRKGAEYTYFGMPMYYAVGHQPELRYLTNTEEYLILEDGEDKLLKFVDDGINYSKLNINYGGIAYGTMNVYSGSSGYLCYNSTVDPSIQSLNNNAKLTAINMGNDILPAGMSLTIEAPIDSYIYEVIDGSLKRLSPPALTWNVDKEVWYMPGFTSGKNLIISTQPLYPESEYIGDENNIYLPNDPLYWQNKYSDVRVKNPMTGGYPTLQNSSPVTSKNPDNNIYYVLYTSLALYVGTTFAIAYKKLKKSKN